MMGLFEIIYFAAYSLDTAAKLLRRRGLPAKVISIGNISSGGTGKTPAAIAIADEAARRGYRPCILTRGYKGRIKGTCIVMPGMSASDVGDEPLLMAPRLKDLSVPVVKDPDRYRGGMFALNNISPPPDLFILDDGFQHRRLRRDVDVLLVNARNPFDNGRLLPMGLLREPISRSSRADIIVLTKSSEIDTTPTEVLIRKYNKDASIFRAGHSSRYVVSPNGERMPVGELKDKEVFAFCGIAEPGYFIDTLRRAGADVKGFRQFRDHYFITPHDLREIEDESRGLEASWIITTEKDIMRLGDIELPGNVFSLGIDFDIDKGFYDNLFGRISGTED